MAKLDKRTITRILNEAKIQGLITEEEPKLLNELERIKNADDQIMTWHLNFDKYDSKTKCFYLILDAETLLDLENISWKHTLTEDSNDINNLSFDLKISYTWRARERDYRKNDSGIESKEYLIKHYDFIYKEDKHILDVHKYLSYYGDEFIEVEKYIHNLMIADIFGGTLLAKYGFKFKFGSMLELNLREKIADEFENEFLKLYKKTESTDDIESEIYQFLCSIAGNNTQYKERSLKALFEVMEKYSNKEYINELLEEIENYD